MVRVKKGKQSLKIHKKKIHLTPVTKDTFKRLIKKKYEVSGKLIKTSNHSFNIDKKSIKNGGKDEADIVEYMYTFHTHPKEAYILYNTELGFPSKGDFEVYLESYLKFDNIIHLVVSLEGIYSLTINPFFMNKQIKVREAGKYINRNFSIDKQDFTRKKGVKINNFCIKTPQNFVKYVNTRLYKEGKSLFNLEFKSWKSRNFSFTMHTI